MTENEKTDMPDLLPCPFCGHSAHKEEETGNYEHCVIICGNMNKENCLMNPIIRTVSEIGKTPSAREKAVNIWNTRAAPDGGKDTVAAIKQSLKLCSYIHPNNHDAIMRLVKSALTRPHVAGVDLEALKREIITAIDDADQKFDQNDERFLFNYMADHIIEALRKTGHLAPKPSDASASEAMQGVSVPDGLEEALNAFESFKKDPLQYHPPKAQEYSMIIEQAARELLRIKKGEIGMDKERLFVVVTILAFVFGMTFGALRVLIEVTS